MAIQSPSQKMHKNWRRWHVRWNLKDVSKFRSWELRRHQLHLGRSEGRKGHGIAEWSPTVTQRRQRKKNKVAESAGATPLRGALLSYMEELQHPKSRAEAGGWHAGLAPSESTCYGGCRGELHGGAAAVTQAKLKWGRGGKGREEEPAFIPHFSRSRFSCAK